MDKKVISLMDRAKGQQKTQLDQHQYDTKMTRAFPRNENILEKLKDNLVNPEDFKPDHLYLTDLNNGVGLQFYPFQVDLMMDTSFVSILPDDDCKNLPSKLLLREDGGEFLSATDFLDRFPQKVIDQIGRHLDKALPYYGQFHVLRALWQLDQQNIQAEDTLGILRATLEAVRISEEIRRTWMKA